MDDSLMAEVAQLASQGVVQPIDFINKYDISELEQAMMYMSKGVHMGKIVVTFNDPKAVLRVNPSVPRPTFDPHATYVLAGCLGGVGRSIATWMVDRGARTLAFLSRSGWKHSGASAIVETLRGRGVAIAVVACDITRRDDVLNAVEQIARIGKPIKGVMQAAMVLEDVMFETMTFEQMQYVISPKVHGTLNLHEATLQHQLDSFTMITSLVPYIGTATQTSYGAANAFQDAFARYRLAHSLPAQSISLGLVSDVGVAGAREDLQRSIQRNGIYGNTVAEIVQQVEMAFTSDDAVGGVTQDPLSSGHLLTGLAPKKLFELDGGGAATEFIWSADPRMQGIAQAVQDHHDTIHGSNATAQHSSSSAATSAKDLRALAQSLQNNPDAGAEDRLRGTVKGAISQRLAKLLYVSVDDLDGTKDVASYGIDSMIAAELRNWLMKMFRLDISFLELVGKDMRVDNLVDAAYCSLTAPE
jgi:NAD(P)-dependent dehydrogenase (short-subunit alcohol dehydrogenase family)/aryl carrier-like protein